MNEHLVIVGGGQAATQAVQTSRELGFAGDITVLAGEDYPPYQRPPLSKKYLSGELPRERLFLKPDRFYTDRGVELELGTVVEEIEPEKSRLRLADGRRVDYDHLLLATGSRVRALEVPGSELDGIHYLRTISDVDAISGSLQEEAEIVVVGGGYIGLEIAAVFTGLGHRVTLLEAADRILGRVVCGKTAQFLHDVHSAAGVRIHCDAHVAAFTGSSGVSGVRTTAGHEYACDCVVIGIGILPNTDVAAAAGLATENGIHVDACARTEHERILAAGDCTNHPHPWVGTRVRLESVQNAIEQGKAAARSLVGAPSAFDDVPWFWSDQYDIKLQIAGLALQYDETVLRGSIDERRFAVYYLRNGHPVAVDAVNSPRDYVNARKLLAEESKIPAEAIADTTVDLSRFLAQG